MDIHIRDKDGLLEEIKEKSKGTASQFIRQAIREKLRGDSDILFKLKVAIKYGDCKKKTLLAILNNK